MLRLEKLSSAVLDDFSHVTLVFSEAPCENLPVPLHLEPYYHIER